MEIRSHCHPILCQQLSPDCIPVLSVLQSELGDMDTWHEDANAWEDESSDAAWEADLVLR